MATAQGFQDPQACRPEGQGTDWVDNSQGSVASMVEACKDGVDITCVQREVCNDCPDLAYVAESWTLSSCKGRARLV